MGEVVYMKGPTTMDLPPDRVLTAAIGEMKQVMVIGITMNDEEYFSSSTGDSKEILWLLERCKRAALSHVD